MDLQDPSPVKRGTFHAAYAVPKAARGLNRTMPRLLDHLLCVAGPDDAEYTHDPEPGEFVVVDVKTCEKAWFEHPEGATPDMVTGMVASTFNSTAWRVGPQVWFV